MIWILQMRLSPRPFAFGFGESHGVKHSQGFRLPVSSRWVESVSSLLASSKHILYLPPDCIRSEMRIFNRTAALMPFVIRAALCQDLSAVL